MTKPRFSLKSRHLAALLLSIAAFASPAAFAHAAPQSSDTTSLPQPLAVYGGSLHATASTSGKFAPYYIASNCNGLSTQADGVQARAFILRPLATTSRFSYGFGADAVAGFTNEVDYERYNPAAGWGEMSRRPAALFLQQLYGEIKYRGVFLTAGMKENNRSIFDNGLNSGDIVYGSNARPIPQIRAGFIDFQDIPLTNGWVQIQGEIAYGKFVDNVWLRNHYNRYNSFLTTGAYMQYSRAYFRTNPAKPFSATVGMQHATQFGGKMQTWSKGELVSEEKIDAKFKDFINAFLPWKGGGSGSVKGDKDYYSGNHLGSWDIQLRYRFHDGSALTAYAQLPWEDGSGIGKLNGWDGVWGLRYQAPSHMRWLKEVVAEYIDFTNQSGPIHWAPGDKQGTSIGGEATGSDDYYNNFMYNGWSNYGMSLGSPFVKSPVYNRDGYMRFTDNRIRGFHLGAGGAVSHALDWRVLFSYRTSWGTPFIPSAETLHDTSMLAEISWDIPQVKHLSLLGALAFDSGKLYGNNFGGSLTLRYTGLIF